MLAALAVQATVFLSISAFDPVLQPFLAVPPLSLTPVHVGLLLALAVLAYAIVSVRSAPQPYPCPYPYPYPYPYPCP